jgi:predicted DNA-binding antitoxin AbrB/MazE fold protein
MREQIEVIYENGVFRPLGIVPKRIQEHQELTVTIEGHTQPERWLADADPTVSLETVRLALSKVPGSLAQLVCAERDER